MGTQRCPLTRDRTDLAAALTVQVVRGETRGPYSTEFCGSWVREHSGAKCPRNIRRTRSATAAFSNGCGRANWSASSEYTLNSGDTTSAWEASDNAGSMRLMVFARPNRDRERAPFRDTEQLPCDSMSLADPPVGFGLMSISQMRWIRDKVGNYFRSFQTSVRRFLILRNCLSCCARATNETLLRERQPDCTARS